MPRTPKNYEHLIKNIPSFTEQQWKAHFELYEGYVKKLNEIEDKLKQADPKSANYSYGEISELLRRRSVAYNGSLLHELFFENLTGKQTELGLDLRQVIDENFGSFQSWMDETKACLMSAPGWSLLVRSKEDGSLRNILVQEHHIGVLVEQDILLALDGWEHAYFLDFGTKKQDYIATVEKSINWNVVTKRLESSELKTRAAA